MDSFQTDSFPDLGSRFDICPIFLFFSVFCFRLFTLFLLQRSRRPPSEAARSFRVPAALSAPGDRSRAPAHAGLARAVQGPRLTRSALFTTPRGTRRAGAAGLRPVTLFATLVDPETLRLCYEDDAGDAAMRDMLKAARQCVARLKSHFFPSSLSYTIMYLFIASFRSASDSPLFLAPSASCTLRSLRVAVAQRR